MAAVSHLPHVLANVLVAQAAGALGGERMPATGPSFRDATRVAGANPGIWTGHLPLQPRGAARRRSTARSSTCSGCAPRSTPTTRRRCSAWQATAAEQRRTLLEAGLAGGPVRELRAAVPEPPRASSPTSR